VQPGLGQQFDRVAQFVGKADVGLLNVGDATARNAVERHRHAKGDLGQNGQLVGGVRAVDIHGRIGLGVAQFLGLGKHVVVAAALFRHACEDVIAGAVQNPLQIDNLVGSKRLGDGGDDGDAAGNTGLEGNGPAVCAARVEDLAAMLGQQCLVRRDHVLAGLEQFEHGAAGPVRAPHHFDRDLDAAIVQHFVDIRGQQTGRQRNAASFVEIAHDNAAKLQRSASTRREAVWMFEQ